MRQATNKGTKSQFWAFCILIVSLSLLASSCNTTRFLAEEEALLVRNQLEINGKIENKQSVKNRIPKLYRQTPNENFLFWPREYLYFRSIEKGQKKNFFARWRANQLEEKPVLYQDSLSQVSCLNIESYMGTLGYFDAQCSYSDTIRRQKASVTYTLEPGDRYHVKSFAYRCTDSLALQLLNQDIKNTNFQKGEPVNLSNYQSEVNRVTALMNRNGYAAFKVQDCGQLELRRDGTDVDIVLPLQCGSKNPVYTIGDILVDQNYRPTRLSEEKTKYPRDGLSFLEPPDSTYIRASALSEAIMLRPHSIYNKELVDRTYRNLNGMSAFRFVNIKSNPRPTGDTIDYIIQLAPHDSSWVFESNFDNSFVTIGSDRFLIGGSLGTQFTNRNFLSGSEEFNIGANATGEFDLRRQDQKFNSISASFNSGLQFPRFVDGLGLFSLIRSVKFGNRPLWSDENYLLFREKTSSDISLRYNYNFLVDFWDYHSVNIQYSHRWQPNGRHTVTLGQTGVNLFNARTFSQADSLFSNNPFLENSFSDRLITGVLVKNINYNYSSVKTLKGFSWGANVFADFSGLEVHLLNLLLEGATDPVSISGLELAQFAKFSFDVYANKRFFNRQALAFRFGMGIVRPFGTGKYSDDIVTNVPYIAQFFSGGTNSVRAWQLRELGPGGFEDPLIDPDRTPRTPFYAAGEIRLDLNVEYRFPIWWIFEGALFADAGNIWNVRDERSEAVFTRNFLDQIAIGTGFGVRTDFKYFLLRVDLGYKVRNPYPVLNKDNQLSHLVLDEFRDLRLRNSSLNLAINYPF